MTTNPITVGELNNVPQPGSARSSDWAQDVSHRVVHRFPTRAARDAAYPAAAAGAGATCSTAGVFCVSDGTTWHADGFIPGTGQAPSGSGAGGAVKPGDLEMVLGFFDVPAGNGGNAVLDMSVLISAPAAWSARFPIYVAAVKRFDVYASAPGATTVDAHPRIALPNTATRVEIHATYGGVGTAEYSWYLDPMNFQLSVRLGLLSQPV